MSARHGGSPDQRSSGIQHGETELYKEAQKIPSGLAPLWYNPLSSGYKPAATNISYPLLMPALELTTTTGNVAVNHSKRGSNYIRITSSASVLNITFAGLINTKAELFILDLVMTGAHTAINFTPAVTGLPNIPMDAGSRFILEIIAHQDANGHRTYHCLNAGTGGGTSTPTTPTAEFSLPLKYDVNQIGEIGDPAASRTRLDIRLDSTVDPHIHELTLTGNVLALFHDDLDADEGMFFVLRVYQDDIGGHTFVTPQSDTGFDIALSPNALTILTGMAIGEDIYITNYGSRITTTIEGGAGEPEEWSRHPALQDVDMTGNGINNLASISFSPFSAICSTILPTATHLALYAGDDRDIRFFSGDTDLLAYMDDTGLHMQDHEIKNIDRIDFHTDDDLPTSGQIRFGRNQGLAWRGPNATVKGLTESSHGLSVQGADLSLGGSNRLINANALVFSLDHADNELGTGAYFAFHRSDSIQNSLNLNVPNQCSFNFLTDGTLGVTINGSLVDARTMEAVTYVVQVDDLDANPLTLDGQIKSDGQDVYIHSGGAARNMSATVSNWAETVQGNGHALVGFGRLDSDAENLPATLDKIRLGAEDRIAWLAQDEVTTLSLSPALRENNLQLGGGDLSMFQNSILHCPALSSTAGLALTAGTGQEFGVTIGTTQKLTVSSEFTTVDKLQANTSIQLASGDTDPDLNGKFVLRGSDVLVLSGNSVKNLSNIGSTTSSGGGGVTENFLSHLTVTLAPISTGAANLGVTGRRFQNLYLNNLAVIGGVLQHEGMALGFRGKTPVNAPVYSMLSDLNEYRNAVNVEANLSNLVLLTRLVNTLINDLRKQGIVS